MATAYYIKAYYAKSNQQQPEIRRFTLDISPENDVYNELQTKVQLYLPNNQLEDIILQYNDEENERITFSSNDELRSAIALDKDTKTLKIYVTVNQTIPQQQQQQQDNTTNKECHVGVQCDGCNGPVIGFRYKCFVCPDYDLCEKCSSAGIHSEHNMIKITKPGSFHHPHGYHHHHHHHPHMSPPPPPPPFIPNQDYLEKIQAQIPQWLPNHHNAPHFRAHVQQHLDSLRANTQTQMQNSKQYLESVGQYLQQALSPFGIDCDYHVDETKPTTTTNEQQEEQVLTNEQQEEQVLTNQQQHEEETSTTNSNVTLNSSDVTETNNNNQDQTASSIIPPVENSTKIRTPLERTIDDCMERMKAMGFIDANGALRELIRSKQGDINLVLDAINPRHYQT
ncbi:unnamed protein product [Rotaria sp. Silwood2]|nr:unnamed protein product [Rotaria sp. Silwood2]CAF4295055.1 unnamed protein product [Rotaria sp. Silwood2]